MVRSLLVPLDGSTFGEHALPVAHAIASRSGAALHLVHVHVPINVPTMADVYIGDTVWHRDAEDRKRERAYLQTLRAQLVIDPELEVTCDLLNGPVVTTLAEHARVSQSDLVVMTTHGRSGLTRLWLGSVADALIRQSLAPLLLMRPHETQPEQAQANGLLQKILVPLDGSPLAEQVLGPACALAGIMGAALTLLQVIAPFRSGGYTPGIDVADLERDIMQRRRSEAVTYLTGVADRVHAEGLAVKTHVCTARHPAFGILTAARHHQSDLIALATHGRGGLARVLLGSVADKVVRGAESPVLLYRPQQQGVGHV